MVLIKFIPNEVNIPNFKVNSIGKACILSYGQNIQVAKDVTVKKNQGYGEQNADQVKNINPISTINDQDISDCNIVITNNLKSSI